jgi:hypothetical protein
MIVVSIKLAALGIAVAIISILVHHYGFNNYVAIAGIVAYIIAKAVLWIPRAMRRGGLRRISRSYRSFAKLDSDTFCDRMTVFDLSQRTLAAFQ